MQQLLTIQLQGIPASTFHPLAVLPRHCDHPIRYARASLLQHEDTAILRQSVSGWQFDAHLFTSRSHARIPLTLHVPESRVFFVYQLRGDMALHDEKGQLLHIGRGHYCGIYLPRGSYRITLTEGPYTMLAFTFPYGYLTWLLQRSPHLQPLATHWKDRPAEYTQLPVCRVDQAVRRTFALLKNCPKRGAELDGALKVYFARFIAHYHQRLAAHPAAQAIAATIVAVQEYLYAHFTEQQQPTLAALSQRFTLSDTHLRRAYREAFGQTIPQTIQQLRVEESKRLLTTTTRSVEAIAYAVGYGYPNSFIKVFKRHTGLSPKAYRQQHR